MTRPSYAWSLHTDVSDVAIEWLSDNAYIGLFRARDLALAARDRSRVNLKGSDPVTPVTVATLALREGVSETTLRRWINEARQALFGQLSDAAIYKRVQRKRQPRHRGFRTCSEPGCHEHLRGRAHGNRKYCDRHATGRARTRRARRETLSR